MKSEYEDKSDWLDQRLEERRLEPLRVAEIERKSRMHWVIFCLILGFASLLFRLILWTKVEQTALLFIGLPTVIAILIGLTPDPRSMTGRILKTTTLALLVVGILAIEGMICILMAAPLFYLVGIVVGLCIDSTRITRERRFTRLNCCVFGALLLMGLEGATEWLSFDRNETVRVTRVVPLGNDAVRSALANGPEHFDLGALPTYLKVGFPAPQSIVGNGIDVGAEWRVHFAGGEGKPGDLVMRVTDSEKTRVIFDLVSDQSHIAHWLTWHDVTWDLAPIDTNQTQVTMTLRYSRDLDPAWYFGPSERYAVRIAGGYFMDSLFSAEGK